MPTVSIIIPVYCVEEYIDKCIQSVLAQTYTDWELIVIDDGSPDNSGIICDRYASNDNRISVIHKRNEGVSRARNVGIEASQGKYICFIDSDDWVEPTYIESLLRYINKGEGVIYGNVINDYYDGRKSVAFNYKEGHFILLDNGKEDIVRYRILENGLATAKLFSKSIIDKYCLRFDENLSYHEDHLFVLKYLSHVKMVILSDNADYHYEHRKGNNSLSKRKHAAAKLIEASSKLISAISVGNERWQICDRAYLKRLYTFLGLNQLMIALSGASKEELPVVAQSIRSNTELFRRYYSPNHRVLKIVPYLILCRFEKVYSLLLRWKGKHS